MKIVRESINFERGLEPKTSINIGGSYLDKKILEETDWAIDIEKHGFIYELIQLIRDYKGYPILVLKNKQQESWPYRAISVRGAFGDYHPTPEKALKQIKSIIDGMLNPMRESLDFERGKDPKRAMDIGKIHNAAWILNDLFFTQQYGESDVEGYRAEILSKDNEDTRKPTYFIKYMEGPMEGQISQAEKFEELFGQWWGMAKSKKRPYINNKRIHENLNFERGQQDPIRAMNIGMFKFDVEFSGDIENMEADEKRAAKNWNHNGVKIISVEGNADEDSAELYFKLSDGDEIVFKSRSYSGPSRPERPDYAKISVANSHVRDLEVYNDWLDELSNGSVIMATMRMYEDIKNKNLVKESINFERGLEPKKAMGIGLTAWEKRIIKETDWHEDLEGSILKVADIIKVVPDYMDSPIVILKLQPNKFAVGQEPYLGISKFARTDLVETPEIAEHDAKIDIENHYIRERDLKKMNLK